MWPAEAGLAVPRTRQGRQGGGRSGAANAAESVGFTDQRIYDEQQLKGILGAQDYTAGIRYGGTYGVNPLACLQGFKDLLIDNGMQVFESTEMERLEDHTAYTHAGSVTADHIIVAVDKLERIDQPAGRRGLSRADLPERDRAADRPRAPVLFPSGEQMQCWDSKLVYSYFRLTGDNRLLLGGGYAGHHVPEGCVQQSGASSGAIIKDFTSTSRSCRTCRSSSSGRDRSI